MSLLECPLEIIELIISWLTYKDFNRLCQINQQLYQYYKDPDSVIWRTVIRSCFPNIKINPVLISNIPKSEKEQVYILNNPKYWISLYNLGSGVANLCYASFKGAYLEKYKFNECNMYHANFEHANLTQARFGGVISLKYCNFHSSKLKEARFCGVMLYGADFTNANVINAKFDGANLENTKFINAEITGTSYREANLTNAKFIGAKGFNTGFHNAITLGTIFPDTLRTRLHRIAHTNI